VHARWPRARGGGLLLLDAEDAAALGVSRATAFRATA
jgi:hypothetical protein